MLYEVITPAHKPDFFYYLLGQPLSFSGFFEIDNLLKDSHRLAHNLLKTAATGVGSATLAGIGTAGCSSTEFDQVKNWDYEAEIVVLGLGAAGLMTAITAKDKGADVLILV